MIFSILIKNSPCNLELSSCALKYCESLVNQGHSIEQIFFYGDGVEIANNNRLQSPDDFNIYQKWYDFFEEQRLEPLVCSTAAARRGLFGDEEAARNPQHITANIFAPYSIAGLGQLVEACTRSDRLISFG